MSLYFSPIHGDARYNVRNHDVEPIFDITRHQIQLEQTVAVKADDKEYAPFGKPSRIAEGLKPLGCWAAEVERWVGIALLTGYEDSARWMARGGSAHVAVLRNQGIPAETYWNLAPKYHQLLRHEIKTTMKFPDELPQRPEGLRKEDVDIVAGPAFPDGVHGPMSSFFGSKKGIVRKGEFGKGGVGKE